MSAQIISYEHAPLTNETCWSVSGDYSSRNQMHAFKRQVQKLRVVTVLSPITQRCSYRKRSNKHHAQKMEFGFYASL